MKLREIWALCGARASPAAPTPDPPMDTLTTRTEESKCTHHSEVLCADIFSLQHTTYTSNTSEIETKLNVVTPKVKSHNVSTKSQSQLFCI